MGPLGLFIHKKKVYQVAFVIIDHWFWDIVRKSKL